MVHILQCIMKLKVHSNRVQSLVRCNNQSMKQLMVDMRHMSG
jgi:hypothetical protein